MKYMDIMKIYRENPFFLLSHQPEMSNGSGEKIFADLPDQAERFKAELRWFPGTDTAEIKKLLEYSSAPGKFRMAPDISTSSVIAGFNKARLLLLNHIINTVQEFKAILYAISIAGDSLLPEQVIEEINADRVNTVFPEITDTDQVEREITELFRETALILMGNLSDDLKTNVTGEKLEIELLLSYTEPDSICHNSRFLKAVIDEIRSFSAEEKEGAQAPSIFEL